MDAVEPFMIIGQRTLDDGTVGFDAVTAQGRTISVVVPWWNTTAEGINAALLRSAHAQLEADRVLLAVRESWAADERDFDAVDDTDTDTATS